MDYGENVVSAYEKRKTGVDRTVKELEEKGMLFHRAGFPQNGAHIKEQGIKQFLWISSVERRRGN